MSDYLNTTDDAPDITLGEAMEEIRALHVAGERLRRERDEARAELAENEAVIAVWRGRTERAEKERDEARALLEIADLAQMEAKEAEARGYRRGVQDAAKAIGEALESPVEQRCCGFGLGSPPECCATPISLIEGEKAHAAILALLEQTGEPGEKK